MPILISIGENCLVDHMLQKFGLKKESYPFGSCRSNIEYIIQIINSDFSLFLDKKVLHKDYVDANQQVIKNKSYYHTNNIYCSSVSNGYEFTHHNILEDEDLMKSFIRRVKRFKSALSGTKKVVLIYYYKHNEKRNITKIIELINDLQNLILSIYGKICKCILIYQIVSNDRRIELKGNDNILICEFYCEKIWGSYKNWNAIGDQDLFQTLFECENFKKFVIN